MRLAVSIVLLLAFVTFAGCLGGGEEKPPQATAPPDPKPGPGASDGDRGYEAKEGDDGAHDHDMWGRTTTMVLYDDAVETDPCNQPGKALVDAMSAAKEARVQNGCAFITFQEKVLVHEGTESLTVELDTSDTELRHGDLVLWYANGKNKQWTYLEPCPEADAVCTWTIPVARDEWDIPHSETSAWGFGIEPRGNVGVISGEIDVYVQANRMPDWTPILGSAHIDHWAEGAAHDFIKDDRSIMRLMDATAVVDQPSAAGRDETYAYQTIDLADIIAPGARQVTAVYAWEAVDGCPSTDKCWVEAWFTQQAGTGVFAGELLERSDPSSASGYAIYRYDVPEKLPADSTYAEASQYKVRVHLQSCFNGQQQSINGKGLDTCNGESVAGLSANVRVEIEAWQKNADIQELKQRLGI